MVGYLNDPALPTPIASSHLNCAVVEIIYVLTLLNKFDSNLTGNFGIQLTKRMRNCLIINNDYINKTW
jgi:hypothetical protein